MSALWHKVWNKTKQNKTRKKKRGKRRRYGRNSLTESNSVCEVLLLKDNRMNACAYIHTYTRASRRLFHTLSFSHSLYFYVSVSPTRRVLFPRFLNKKKMTRSKFFFISFRSFLLIYQFKRIAIRKRNKKLSCVNWWIWLCSLTWDRNEIKKNWMK